MKLSFWKALRRLGASGSATLSWQHVLGSDWESCRHLLQPAGQSAHCVLHPQRPEFQLDLMPEGEEDFVAVCEDTSIPPIPVTAAEAEELAPCWHAIAHELADVLGFTPAVWDHEGCLRRIGSAQDGQGLVTPVLLFLPPGGLADGIMLLESLMGRARSVVLLPSVSWMSPALDGMRTNPGHAFAGIAERLAEPSPAVVLPVLGGPSQPASRAVIRAQAGLAWKDLTVTILTGRTLRLSVPGQERDHTFRDRSKIGELHPLGILMKIADTGEWINPPKSNRGTYSTTVKAFGRLRELLRELAPLPGDPLPRSGGVYQPAFRLEFGPGLSRANRRCRN